MLRRNGAQPSGRSCTAGLWVIPDRMGLLCFMFDLAVASGHASGFFDADIYPKMTGSHAVQVFYIISGFLIALILSGKYADTPQGNWIFYSNRAVKIYVPYLAILAVTVVTWLIVFAASGKAGPFQVFINEGSTMGFGGVCHRYQSTADRHGMGFDAYLSRRRVAVVGSSD